VGCLDQSGANIYLKIFMKQKIIESKVVATVKQLKVALNLLVHSSPLSLPLCLDQKKTESV
jgi:hypothetical protein